MFVKTLQKIGCSNLKIASSNLKLSFDLHDLLEQAIDEALLAAQLLEGLQRLHVPRLSHAEPGPPGKKAFLAGPEQVRGGEALHNVDQHEEGHVEEGGPVLGHLVGLAHGLLGALVEEQQLGDEGAEAAVGRGRRQQEVEA